MEQSNQDLLIHSIYPSFEGEGVRLGIPQIFVRLQGCSIGCINCDSKDTWKFDLAKSMPLSEVVQRIRQLKLFTVSITGGDPLDPRHTPGLLLLLQWLREEKYFVNIEASGKNINTEVMDLCDFISWDVKTPSTKVSGELELSRQMISLYPSKLQFKSVVSDETDFNYCVNFRNELEQSVPLLFPWVLTPAYNLREPFPVARFQLVHLLNQEGGGKFRVIGQQHKWMYGPDVSQV